MCYCRINVYLNYARYFYIVCKILLFIKYCYISFKLREIFLCPKTPFLLIDFLLSSHRYKRVQILFIKYCYISFKLRAIFLCPKIPFLLIDFLLSFHSYKRVQMLFIKYCYISFKLCAIFLCPKTPFLQGDFCYHHIDVKD
jgi:hypothetical protein